MKIRTRLTINFSILVAGILMIFSISVYYFYLNHRQQDFLIRLRNKAINTATLLFNIKGINPQLLKIIDDNTVTNMSDVTVVVIEQSKKVLYSNRDSFKIAEIMPQFVMLDWSKNSHKIEGHGAILCVHHKYQGKRYYVLASAADLYGRAELKKLLIIITGVFIASLSLVIVAGYYNARRSLKPIKDVIEQVDKIKASNLASRLTAINNDEIAELSKTFNKMLERIEQAFETEKMFVTNASHELRTPITSITGQVEVALIKSRSESDYKSTLMSILDDAQNMKTIINGFLELAEASIEPGTQQFRILRTDELLFSVKDEILKRNPAFLVVIEFENMPEDESDVSIMGNDRLLRILFNNLIDNACKFSDQHRVTIKIGYDNYFVKLQFIDNGSGIPKEDLRYVFRPLYRGSNALGKAGHGIGLSIVKRIIDIHEANIIIDSEINIGTRVTLIFQNTKFI